MGTPKEEVRKLLNQIPDDASFEDILYHTHHIQCEDLFMILWTFLSVASGLPPGRRDCANASVRWIRTLCGCRSIRHWTTRQTQEGLEFESGEIEITHHAI